MSRPFFSIVIPTFNRADYLIDIFECLIQQEYKCFEVLICDDGSTDNTKHIVNEYKPLLNLIYLYNNNWGGPAYPRNIGINNSNSDWICFLDSDDLWTKDKLKILHQNIVCNQSVDLWYHLFFCNEKYKNIIIGKSILFDFSNVFSSLLYSGNYIVNSSICVRKNMLIEVGLFTEDREIIGVEDYELLLRLANRKYVFKLINKVLGEYRINDTNISKDVDLQISKINKILNQYRITHNSNKIDSLVNYFKANSLSDSKDFKASIKLYYNILFSDSSFIIKLKSFSKLMINIIHV